MACPMGQGQAWAYERPSRGGGLEVTRAAVREGSRAGVSIAG